MKAASMPRNASSAVPRTFCLVAALACGGCGIYDGVERRMGEKIPTFDGPLAPRIYGGVRAAESTTYGVPPVAFALEDASPYHIGVYSAVPQGAESVPIVDSIRAADGSGVTITAFKRRASRDPQLKPDQPWNYIIGARIEVEVEDDRRRSIPLEVSSRVRRSGCETPFTVAVDVPFERSSQILGPLDFLEAYLGSGI